MKQVLGLQGGSHSVHNGNGRDADVVLTVRDLVAIGGIEELRHAFVTGGILRTRPVDARLQVLKVSGIAQ